MTNDEILDLLPNPDHLRGVIKLLYHSNPKPGAWNDWECDARILNVWVQNLEELIEKLTTEGEIVR